MDIKDNKIFLMHIIDEINFLISETQRMRFEDFMKNEVLKRAPARSISLQNFQDFLIASHEMKN